ncbi:MAG: hypothetical protein CFE44_09650 [Burkholderiales bacterium PBB4]|nr:MAG: hypothetical protein CFE44_09650 [Burkholderiales bacterium PBB4]
MSTKDSRPNLLSKMAMFVRNPTKDWSELDRPEPEQETSYDKQALKAMIERKRQNDFVRKREFDNLRKLRRKDPTAIAGAARPSFFQSSLPADAEGRADTLKKIDEIEAQMSKQWWKGKQEASTAQNASFPLKPVGAVLEPAKADGPTMAPGLADSPFESTAIADISERTQAPPDGEFVPTEMGADMPPLLTSTSQRSGENPGPRMQTTDASEGGFSSSDLLAIETEGLATDPELEEAAIRFANGDDAGAESALVLALGGDALLPQVAEVWVLALLDLYRATSRSDAFDKALIDYAWRIADFRPRWIDIPALPEALPPESIPTGQTQRGLGRSVTERAVWACPVELTASGMEELRVALFSAPPPWHLDWSRLNDIADDAVPFLAGLFGSLCVEEVTLRFSGADRLTKALRDLTPAGSRGGDEAAWAARLDALRTMQLQDEFELVALDFCIAFEVAPPAWQAARSRYIDADMESATQAPPITTTTMPLGLHGSEGTTLVLSGQILGDAVAKLAKLGVDHARGAHLVVSCKGLVRVDFSAAGTILNWVATVHSKGCQVQFRDVNRLVAAFFNVIGITEYARVSPMSIE